MSIKLFMLRLGNNRYFYFYLFSLLYAYYPVHYIKYVLVTNEMELLSRKEYIRIDQNGVCPALDKME